MKNPFKVIAALLILLAAIYVVSLLITYKPCSPNCGGVNQSSYMPLSFSGRDYSWELKYPQAFKLSTTTNNSSPFYRLSIESDGKKICDIYLSMPRYLVSSVIEKGIENIYNRALTEQTLLSNKNLQLSSNSVTLGNMNGMLIEGKTGDNSRVQFVAKYPEKNMVGTFELVCNNVDENIFSARKIQFLNIIESFK